MPHGPWHPSVASIAGRWRSRLGRPSRAGDRVRPSPQHAPQSVIRSVRRRTWRGGRTTRPALDARIRLRPRVLTGARRHDKITAPSLAGWTITGRSIAVHVGLPPIDPTSRRPEPARTFGRGVDASRRRSAASATSTPSTARRARRGATTAPATWTAMTALVRGVMRTWRRTRARCRACLGATHRRDRCGVDRQAVAEAPGRCRREVSARTIISSAFTDRRRSAGTTLDRVPARRDRPSRGSRCPW